MEVVNKRDKEEDFFYAEVPKKREVKRIRKRRERETGSRI